MSTDLPRLADLLADRYRIERELGRGGMATVYLARDLRHERDVAIKVLHPDLGAALGGERFLTEIRTTARLQHPHILPLLDSGRTEGFLYYVMPLVAGETLRARLAREQQLPIDDALRITREVADALGYAHGLGIIHRDIKPENILLQGGHALVADFGIALAVQAAGGARMTQTGLSLGTPQYMSPEQAMGERAIDARSDIYALGAVTYEMLAGDPPFTGSTVQAIIARVLSEKPTALRMLRDTVPRAVEHAVLTSLAKLPADRFASAADFAAALSSDRLMSAATMATAPPDTRALTRARRTSVVAIGVAAVATALALWGWLRPAPAADVAVRRLELTASGEARFAYPLAGALAALALSPDGNRAVVSAVRPSGWALAVRDLDRSTVRLLPGTDGATYPAFSPDGRWIAFDTPDGTIKKIAVDGGTLTTVCSAGSAGGIGLGGGSAGITWLSTTELVFSPRTLGRTGMYRVSASGGTPRFLSRVDTASDERFQSAPLAADGGRLVFYTGATQGLASNPYIGVVDVASGKVTPFPNLRAARALGLVGDFLVYIRTDGALTAAPFDRRALTVGTPIQVGDSVATRTWDAAAGLSETGSLLYQEGGTMSQLVRVEMTGASTTLVDSVRAYVHPRFSPDGKHVAFEVTGQGGSDIWTSDLASTTLERVSSGGVNDRPEWSPDGKRVLYTSSRQTAVWWRSMDGSDSATKLFSTTNPIREAMLTPDGRTLVYRVDTRRTDRDIYMASLAGERKPVPLLNSVSDEKEPRVSPDSKWLAYVSNESGREEVYVRQLAAGGGRVPVSSGGGTEPLWSPDGRRVYYRIADRVMEATLAFSPTLMVTGRRVVFVGPYATDIYHPNYDVAPDGKRFVMVRPAGESRRLVIVLNWARELEGLRGAATKR